MSACSSRPGFRWRPLVFAIAFVLLPGLLRAQEDARTLTINWRAVPGASGYLVQIKNESDEVLIEERVRATSYSFQLPPGNYFHRLAALNRFDSPGAFSAWQPLRIREAREPNVAALRPEEPTAELPGVTRVIVSGDNFVRSTKVFLVLPGQYRQELEVEFIDERTLAVLIASRIVADGQYDLIIENPRGLSTRRQESVRIQNQEVIIPEEQQIAEEPETRTPGDATWSTLVPGLPALQRGDQNAAVAWMGVFGGLLFFTGAEYQAARIVRDEQDRRFNYRLYNEPPLLISTLTVLRPASGTLLLGALGTEQERLRTQSQYQRHQDRQAVLGSLAAVTWLAHFAYENGDRFRWSHLVPGLSYYQRGDPARGTAWLVAMGGVAAAISQESQKAQQQLQAVHRIERAYISSPLFLALLATNRISLPSDFSTAGVYSYAALQRERHNYEGARRSTSQLSAALALLYVLQIVDATFTEGQPVAPPAEATAPSALDRPLFDEHIENVTWHIPF